MTETGARRPRLEWQLAGGGFGLPPALVVFSERIKRRWL